MRVAANKFSGSCARCGAHVPARAGVYLKRATLCADSLKRAAFLNHSAPCRQSARMEWGGGAVPYDLALWAARQNGVRQSVSSGIRCD